MRRKDREVTDFSKITEIISSCDCCRLGFVDGEFPEVKLTTVLQASEGRARMRHVFSGEGCLLGGETVTLTALVMKTVPKLYAFEDGDILPMSVEEGLLPCRTLVAETDDGAVLISGGDFFAVANDEDGFCLAAGIRLDKDVDLTKEGPLTCQWVEIIMGENVQSVTAAAEE